MKPFPNPTRFFADLKAALGLEGHVIRRLVIEVDCHKMPVVYVQKLLARDEGDGVVKAVADAPFRVVEADVVVGPDGEIIRVIDEPIQPGGE